MLDNLFGQFDSIVFLDVETSGLNSRTDEIIEFGLLRVIREGEKLLTDGETGMLVRMSPGKKLSGTITQLTGITQSMLDREGIAKNTACETLKGYLDHGKQLLVAYNAQFDLCFLYFFLKNFGTENVMRGTKLLDALMVYRDRRGYPHKLEDAVAAYAIETKCTHRAIDDARAAFSVLSAMDQELGDLDRYINLFGYNPKYGISGQRISSVRYVPQPYNHYGKLYE
ncbi:MAG: 3'-5' exonuclease [Clostridia bacterium]|nr:3'-5' exonuclease [Clostridia bacterium]